MNAQFALQLALSFVVGGLWIVAATVLAERLGPKVGGLISGLPSTVILTLFFLAWTQNSASAVQATTVIPLGVGMNCLFLASYVYLVRKKFWQAVAYSLVLWFGMAYILVKARFDNYAVSLFGFGFLFVLSFFLIERVFKIASIKGKTIRYTPALLLARALTGGLAVFFAVYLGKIGGPLWGGIFSTFPAMFISTMLVTYFSQGALFSAGVMKNAMLSSISIAVYAFVARLVYLPLGLWLGTFVSILLSYGSGWAIYKSIVGRGR